MTGRNRYRVKYYHAPPPNTVPGEKYAIGAGIWSVNIYAHNIDDARHKILKNFPRKNRAGKIFNRIIVSCRKIYY
tara:strand:+ start:1574 stop:1798 length:225 start_codon:yes stop_codon:yes gene_type:complete